MSKPNFPLLESINSPADLRRLSRLELKSLARELREFLLLAHAQQRVAGGAVHAVQTKVVGAPLEQGNAGVAFERLAHPRQVNVVELVLQRAGGGRQNGAGAGHQRGHQIGEGFAGAGTRFADQSCVGVDGCRHAVGHFLLGRARLKAVDHGGDRAAGGQRVARIQAGSIPVGSSSSRDQAMRPMRWNLGMVSVPRLLDLDSSSASSTASRLAS